MWWLHFKYIEITTPEQKYMHLKTSARKEVTCRSSGGILNGCNTFEWKLCQTWWLRWHNPGLTLSSMGFSFQRYIRLFLIAKCFINIYLSINIYFYLLTSSNMILRNVIIFHNLLSYQTNPTFFSHHRRFKNEPKIKRSLTNIENLSTMCHYSHCSDRP